MKKDEEIYFHELGPQSIIGHSFNGFIDVSCFVTVRNFVECLVNYDNKLEVEIYDELINHLNTIDI